MSRPTSPVSNNSTSNSLDFDMEKHESSSADSLLAEESFQPSRQPNRHQQRAQWINFGFALLLCSVFSFAAGYWVDSLNLKARCFAMDTIHSPVKAALKPEYKLVRFNGTLNWDTPFTGRNKAVDEAWHKMSRINWFSVSKDDVVKSGGSVDAVRLPDEKGGGYMATMDMTHQLHCLNFVRKSLYHNYDYYKTRTVEFKDPKHTVEVHIDHCVEIIRQNILCHADPGILSHHWMKDYPRPYPNFNTWKVCRNPEAVAEWGQARTVKGQGSDWSDLIRPGSKFWDEPPAPEDFPTPPPWDY